MPTSFNRYAAGGAVFATFMVGAACGNQQQTERDPKQYSAEQVATQTDRAAAVTSLGRLVLVKYNNTPEQHKERYRNTLTVHTPTHQGMVDATVGGNRILSDGSLDPSSITFVSFTQSSPDTQPAILTLATEIQYDTTRGSWFYVEGRWEKGDSASRRTTVHILGNQVLRGQTTTDPDKASCIAAKMLNQGESLAAVGTGDAQPALNAPDCA